MEMLDGSRRLREREGGGGDQIRGVGVDDVCWMFLFGVWPCLAHRPIYYASIIVGLGRRGTMVGQGRLRM